MSSIVNHTQHKVCCFFLFLTEIIPLQLPPPSLSHILFHCSASSPQLPTCLKYITTVIKKKKKSNQYISLTHVHVELRSTLDFYVRSLGIEESEPLNFNSTISISTFHRLTSQKFEKLEWFKSLSLLNTPDFSVQELRTQNSQWISFYACVTFAIIYNKRVVLSTYLFLLST